MKLNLIFLIFSFHAFAATVTVDGSGYANGYCRGDNFSHYCVSQLEDRAEQDASRDADRNCQIKRGNLLPYTGSCWTNCNPPTVPNNPNSPGTYVSCRASCRFSCEIRNP